MSFYSLIFGDTLDNLFTRYAWRFLFLTVGIFFLLDLILSFLNEFEDLSEFYSFSKILFFLAFTSVDAVFDIFPLSAIVSTIICMGAISDSGELIAARVSGKKLSRIIFAVLKPVIFGILLMLVSWQFFIPNLQEAANNLKFEPTSNVSEQKEQWVFKNDRFSKVIDKGTSKEVKIYDLDEKGNVDSIVVSKDIEIAENEWVIKEVRDYKEDISQSDFIWEDAPKLWCIFPDEIRLTDIFLIVSDLFDNPFVFSNFNVFRNHNAIDISFFIEIVNFYFLAGTFIDNF